MVAFDLQLDLILTALFCDAERAKGKREGLGRHKGR